MRIIHLLFIAFLLMQFTSLAQPGWFWQNPKPQGNTLNDVWAFDENNFIAVGNAGVIINSSDGGVNWTQYFIGMSNNLISIHFINEYTGWIVGDGGIVFRTTDGGESWAFHNNGINDGFCSVYFMDENVGWAACGNGKIFNTTDGGINWDLQLNSGYEPGLSSIFFTDQNNGRAIGQGVSIWASRTHLLCKTTNGGVDWIEDDTIGGKAIFFIDDNTGWITTLGGGILKTTDGGENWVPQISGVESDLVSVYFLDENYGWAVGGGYTSAYPNVGDEHTIILNTTNGGENWSTQFGEIGWPLTAVHFINQNIGLTVGEAGIILKTTDGGNIWTSLTKGNYSNRQSILYSVHFSNLNNGWAVGTFRNSYTGPYYPETFKTTNGGEDWIEQDSIGGKAVFFIDENTGWITAGNIILKTTNGGEDWIEQNSIGGNAIFFIDENTGWITASNIILKTTNGGEDWIEQNNLGGNSIFFIDDYYGWVVGDQGRVLKTTNSGTVWISIPGVSFSDLMSVYFDNQNNGWIAGTLNSPRDGIILRTIDGGLNWSYIITDDPLSSIYFPNEFIGWAIGEEGAVFRTTDRGDNWSKQLINTDCNLYSIYFLDQNLAWVVGANGAILHTTNGGATFVEEDEIDQVATDYHLSNNFPNPFNPSTKIRYSVPQSSQVQIKVFDILGNEIETLVNEEKPVGTYQVNWFAENLPSGIYFYRLQAGSYIETKKMVLMK